jgi:hypothetical protein
VPFKLLFWPTGIQVGVNAGTKCLKLSQLQAFSDVKGVLPDKKDH